MQLRSTYQHAWATAVETVGIFLKHALKSRLGEAEWLRFFALMGTVLALKENTRPVPNTLTTQERLFSELYELAIKLDVENRLSTYVIATQGLERSNIEGAAYFLLRIDPEQRTVDVKGFSRMQIAAAADEYLEVEKTIGKSNVDACSCVGGLPVLFA